MPTYRNDSIEGKGYSVQDYLGNNKSVGVGDVIKTYKILEAPFTKLSDDPYFPLVLVDDPAFASPGTKAGLLNCSVIRVMTNNSGITVKANSSSNPAQITLPVGISLDIPNTGEIESLVFSGTGTVSISGM